MLERSEEDSPDYTVGRGDAWVSLDIVVPVYNEQEVLPMLLKTLGRVFRPDVLKAHRLCAVNFICVDDGSVDRSAEIIMSHLKQGLPIRLCRLTRNFGHQSAVEAGLSIFTGDVVAVLDADLQDPPEVILEMLDQWRRGYDVVYGLRRARKEPRMKVCAYWIFYRLLSFLADIDVPHDTGDFALMDRRVAETIRDLPEKLKFMRVLRAWVGFRQTGVEYQRERRQGGTTKYSLRKLFSLATDGIVAASVRPLRLSQLFGVCYLGLLAVSGLALCLKLSKYQGARGGPPYLDPQVALISQEVSLWFLLLFVITVFSAFVQIVSIYMLSAYLARAYLEVKGRPPYLILDITDSHSRERHWGENVEQVHAVGQDV